MSFAVSIVTMNRSEILARTIQAINATCQAEKPAIYITDNASTDGTVALLWCLKRDGYITDYVSLPENLGTEGGRNAHFAHCLGHDTVRMDDKVLPLVSGWLSAMKRQADSQHCLVATPYDPTVLPLLRIAPAVEFVRWDNDAGRGGPLIFIPAEVTTALGGCDELHPDHKYGFTDCLYIERAALLGWGFGFSLRVPVEYLAQASPERRAAALEWHPLYMDRRRQYEAAERDVFIPMESTAGYKMGVETKRP